MARDLELNVKSKTSGAGLTAAAAEVQRLAREADRMGTQFKQATRDAEKLDRQLAETAVAAKLLAKEFAAVDDPKSQAALKEKINANRSAATELKRLRAEIIGDTEKDANAATNAWKKSAKELERVTGAAERSAANEAKKIAKDLEKITKDSGKDNAGTFAAAFQGGIIDAFKALPPEAKAAVVEGLIVAITAAAAPIGAAINGALLAGIGLGGIGLGIAGQIDNPEVQAAGKQLGTDLKAALTDATSGFAKPLVSALGIIDQSAVKGIASLRGEFDRLATHVEPLARGLAGMFEAIKPGFEKALEAAGPILDELSAKLPGLGQNISKFFALLADGSAGAKDGLDLLILTVETLLVGIGGLIDGFSHLYHAFLAPGRELKSFWDDFRGNTAGVAHSLDAAAESADNFGQSAEQGVGSLEALNTELHKTAVTADSITAGAVDKLVNSMLGLDQATLGLDESLTNLGEAIKQNGKTLNEHTAKGQANREAILAGVAANLRLYDAEIASGTSAEEAGKKFQAHNDQLRAAAIAAGLNAGEVDKMIKKYGQVPPEIQTQIAMHGLQEAISNLDETLRLINHLPPRRSVDIDVNVHGNLFAASNAISKVLGSGFVSSGLGHRAGGGPVTKGQPYIVGEHRPEVFVPAVNGMILPKVPDTIGQSGPSPAALWQGGGTSTAVNVALSAGPGGDHATAQLVSTLINYNILRLTATADGSVKVA